MELPFLKGKIVVLYGGTSGLGVGLAEGLAAQGAAAIYMVCRSEAKGQELANRLGVPVFLEIADGCDPAAMRAAGANVASKAGAIHVVMLNAALIPGRKPPTASGFEEGFAVTYLSLCALTAGLMPALGRGSRIVVTGSEASRAFAKLRVDWDNLQGEKGLNTGKQVMAHYGNCKLLNHMWAAELASRLSDRAVSVNWWHPGAVQSQLGNDAYPRLAACIKGLCSCIFRSPNEGAKLGLFIAGRPEDGTGQYFSSGNTGRVKNFEPQPIEGDIADLPARQRLWSHTESLIGPLI